ncbi:MAG: site-specific DNA-methyltransferase, partial [Rhodospirillales bacterium]|nr:site-specific DNA-methyltransferase [Rhodospirillales bacterium]
MVNGKYESALRTDVIRCCDALTGLRKLPNDSIDCVITSPPYWSMRDYGVEGQVGLESSFEAYLSRLLEIFDEVHRVLRPTGTFWLNIGDTYGGNAVRSERTGPGRGPALVGNNGTERYPHLNHTRGRYSKSLLGIPERLMLALVERGWTLRNKIIWNKPNHMPSPVKDRLTNCWEYVYFFTRSKRYHFDLDAIRVPHKSLVKHRRVKDPPRQSPHPDGRRMPPKSAVNGAFHPKGKNPADHWSVSPEVRSRDTLGGAPGAP